jgi:outer membrane protein assembly factor BamB
MLARLPRPLHADASAWTHWGGDKFNRRWAMGEKALQPSNAGGLRVKWEASVAGSTSATPTVAAGRVYLPDWEGHLYCLDASTGAVVWDRRVSDLLAALGVALPGARARAAARRPTARACYVVGEASASLARGTF